MKPDLDAIRARCEAAQVIFERSSVVAPCVYDDIPALLAYVEELERQRNAALREVAGAKRALADYDRACAQVSSLTVENAELKARIAVLEAMKP